VTIRARIRQAGLHHWPPATAHRASLAKPHRHEFVITAEVEPPPAGGDDRPVEFHDLAEAMRLALVTFGADTDDPNLLDFGPQSCEALARRMLRTLATVYTVVAVEWSEDGEFTSRVTPEG